MYSPFAIPSWSNSKLRCMDVSTSETRGRILQNCFRFPRFRPSSTSPLSPSPPHLLLLLLLILPPCSFSMLSLFFCFWLLIAKIRLWLWSQWHTAVVFLVSSLVYSSRWNKAGTHRLPFRTHRCRGEGISSPTLYLPSFLLSIYVFIFIKQEKEALKGIDDCDLPALVILIRDAQLEVCHPLSYSLLSLPLLSFLPVLTFVFLFFNAFQKYTMEKHPDFQLAPS